MTLAMESDGDVLVFSPKGRLDSNNAGAAEAEVRGQIENGQRRLLFDFADLDYISSAGLRTVLIAAKRIKQEGGRMALCNLKPHIHEVFEISGFLSILDVAASRDEAMRSLSD